MAVILTIIAVLFLVLVCWMWNSLGNIEKTTKITYMVGGLIIVYIITFVIYNISKIGIIYEDKEVMKIIQTVFTLLFTIINGYIILPYAFRKLEQVNNGEIEKEKLTKSMIIICVIVLVLAIFENSYLKSIQQGILNLDF